LLNINSAQHAHVNMAGNSVMLNRYTKKYQINMNIRIQRSLCRWNQFAWKGHTNDSTNLRKIFFFFLDVLFFRTLGYSVLLSEVFTFL